MLFVEIQKVVPGEVLLMDLRQDFHRICGGGLDERELEVV